MMFTAEVRRSGDAAVIDMSGLLDRTADEVMQAAWAEVANTTSGPVLLDFEDVEYINSTGIALVVGILARARAAERQLRAFGLSPHYREIFRITRLSDFMAMFDTETAAAVG